MNESNTFNLKPFVSRDNYVLQKVGGLKKKNFKKTSYATFYFFSSNKETNYEFLPKKSIPHLDIKIGSIPFSFIQINIIIKRDEKHYKHISYIHKNTHRYINFAYLSFA